MFKILMKNMLSKLKYVEKYDGVLIAMDQLSRDALRHEIDADRIPRRHRCQYEYDIKSIVINKAIQDIGMGRYNWNLFFLCGIGWLFDNLWLQQVALTLPSLSDEFNISNNDVRYTTCYLFVGLCLGTIFWGIGSDIIGRRVSFNLTLLIAGTSGIAVGVSSSWLSVCLFYLIIGFGIGGNLPVVSALFLETLPHESGRYLTLLSIWWPIGQLISSFSAWCFMGDHRYPKNGWRYFSCVLGALTCLMILGRFIFFNLLESPKYLLSRGRQAEAVIVVHGIAHRNKTKTWLTEDILNEFGGLSEPNQRQSLPVRDIVYRKLSNYSMKRFTRFFASRDIAKNTALLWFCWFAIGLGYPLFNDFLPQYLSSVQESSDQQLHVYRDYIIITIVSIPGSILACYTVDVQGIGRKGTMAVSTLMAGIMLIVFILSPLHLVQVGISAVQGFFQNAMYAVLFTYTPESFPAPIRCTGSGISGFLNRIGGLAAVIIGANLPATSSQDGVIIDPKLPAIISGIFMVAAFLAMLFLSVETRGEPKL
ncbi:putative MFS-type transporter PB1E7.08c [Erysiphe neolycopersici]|uniref:Putative MFS-type transporter PB1E7.08c n=1 Tax=Erysiphe neolycopersici TaxID=212602 RepID=A0A420HYZ4_9PEZI|nr:putative MFS-type transporter PB1E7.08c [Erysiphe neolycopersici]